MRSFHTGTSRKSRKENDLMSVYFRKDSINKKSCLENFILRKIAKPRVVL